MKTKYFGFNGVSLAIPLDWDMKSFKGDQRAGAISFDDEMSETMRVEWGTAPGLGKDELFDEFVKNNKARIDVADRRDVNGYEIFLKGRCDGGPTAHLLKLQPDWKRYFIFHWFKPEGDALAKFNKLTAPLNKTRPDAPQKWDFFATRFTLDPKWSLREGKMLAGRVELTFERDKRLLVIWDLALLNQTLKRRSLLQTAANLVEEKFPKRLSFDTSTAQAQSADERAQGFSLWGKWRQRWLINPSQLFFGNRLAWMQCVVSEVRNRFTYVLLLCRDSEEYPWMGNLPETVGA